MPRTQNIENNPMQSRMGLNSQHFLAAATGKVPFCPPPVFPLRGGERAMQGSLGENICEGITADIHVWAPGQLVKLFKMDFSSRFSRREAQMTRAAIAAGAPEVLDEVTVEGRFGIVLQRLDGPTLLQFLQTRATQVGTILANLYPSVHKTSVRTRAGAACRSEPSRSPLGR